VDEPAFSGRGGGRSAWQAVTRVTDWRQLTGYGKSRFLAVELKKRLENGDMNEKMPIKRHFYR
jgi:hypothetical protein